MRWWARRRLRAQIFLPHSALILGTVLVTLWLVNAALRAQVEQTLTRELAVTGQVFQGLVTDRTARLRTDASLVATDFALKRVIATYDRPTLVSAARTYRDRLGVDLLWITDERGTLLTHADRDVPARSPAAEAPLAESLATHAAAGAITALDGALVQLVAVPVQAPDTIGFLLAGDFLDDATALQLEQQTGSAVSFLSADRVFASSWPSADRAGLFPDGRLAPAALQNATGTTFLLTHGGQRWLSILVPIAARLPSPLYALVQQSYDRALAPLHALRRRIAAIGAAALLGALVVGAALAGGIAAPLLTLVAAMREVLAGNFHLRVPERRQDEIGFLTRAFNEMTAGLAERDAIKDTFGRFVSRDVAVAVLSGQMPLEGERREVTILFQDTRGFTSLAERTAPVVLVGLVNRMFTEMVAAVETEGGIIKQFTGDGVMALFGAPVAHPDDPERAVRAALRMAERLPDLNAWLATQGVPPVRIGIGIHTGEVVAGRIGPDTRVEYTVVGDPVNLASRIEGLTKDMQTMILVSATTAARLPGQIRLGRRAVLAVRGKEHPVEVVEVLG